MFGLALHTSSDILGLGLAIDSEIRTCTWPEGRTLSENLQQRLADWVAPRPWSDLAWLAVCIGPGSFTGTRLGVVTARTLAQTLAIPLLGINALEALAFASGGSVAVSLDARRGDRYAAIYAPGAEDVRVLHEVALIPAADWPGWLAARPPGTAHLDADALSEPPIAALTALARLRFERGLRPEWSTVVPLYAREAPIHPGALG